MVATVVTDPSDLADIILASGLFDGVWYGQIHGDVAASGLSAEQHFRQFGLMLHRPPCPDLAARLDRVSAQDLPEADRAAVMAHYVLQPPMTAVARAAAGTPPEFDTAFYLQTNPVADLSKVASPYEHFLRWGYRDLRNPGPDFDLVWYAQNYGHEFATPDENPFLHYLLEGKDKGYVPHPPRPLPRNLAASRPLPATPRRACLFAAYDPHLRVDDYVLIFLRELARHADVFYLADCDMPANELAKLEGITKGAWGQRHGAYDFGSYSMLARDLVGWDRLADYDEVLFVNDSCFLVRPLDEVFATMAARPCAWWGLQATKGLAATRGSQPFPFPVEERLSIETLRHDMLDRFEMDPVYDFHVGSYFTAFRREVIADPRFRRVMDAVRPERNKYTIVRKYEVGLTRFLIGCGYEFDTWVPETTRRHPVYTDVIFGLIRAGFPLFKRYFVSDNPYGVASMAYWPALLDEVGSLTPLPMIEANIRRLSRDDRLHRNYGILTDGAAPPAPLPAATFTDYDCATPTYDHYWGFPVCRYDHSLSDNGRAVFEAVKNDPRITKVIFTRGKVIETDGVNVITVPLMSHEGQTLLARCRHLFVRHGAKANLEWPLAEGLHNIINLWHGVPLKRIGFASLDKTAHATAWEEDNRKLKAVISASDVDRLAMTAAYWPLGYDDIWLTGLPRHDFITMDEDRLPAILTAQLADIRERKAGRRMILFCPTFRNDQKKGYYNFTPAQVARLSDWLATHGFVMAIREHPADKARQYSSQLRGPDFLQVPAASFPDVEMLYREADILITDYSSVFIDFMLTGRPAISFAYDRKAYETRERGLFYDLAKVFPGPIVENVPALLRALTAALAPMTPEAALQYAARRDHFLNFTDAGNAGRVVAQVQRLNRGSSLLPGFGRAARAPKTGPKTVVFLYSATQSITNRYRIFALVPELQRLGWVVHTLDQRHASPALLAQADIVSLCRLEQSERLRDLVEGARACGARIVYDTDDLLHDYLAFTRSEYFRRDPQRANALHRLSAGTRAVMAMADGFTLSTAPLLQTVTSFGKPAAVVPNSLESALLAHYADDGAAAERSGHSSAPVRISYLSGTATHSRDFEECFAALAAVLPQMPGVELHIVGPLTLPEKGDPKVMAQMNARVRRHGLMSYRAMHDFLRGMDINLAPLAPGVFNDAKSELKIFEAALHGVPTIASPTAGHRATIRSGQDGILAQTQADWDRALRSLIGDAALRADMGARARADIVPRFTAAGAAARLVVFLETLIDQEGKP